MKKEPHVVTELHEGGRMTLHHVESKAAAHEKGMALRREGKAAFAYSSKDFAKHNPMGLRAWVSKTAGVTDEYARDDQGRFAAKS